LTSTERRYDDGNIVFREGEASDSAFVIVEGQIKITKSRADGALPLAVLEAGELFGEMGILDKGIRSATATAVGNVTLKVISGDTFLESLKTNPSMAFSVMERLVHRLRAADTMLVGSAAPEISPGSAGRKSGPGFFKRLFRFGSGSKIQRVDIWVANVPGENGPRHTSRVIAALGRHRGVRVRAMGKILAPTVVGTPGEQFAAAAHTARSWLDQVGGDLLIWGQIPDADMTLRLRFVSAAIDSEDRPGIFDLATALDLPPDFGSEFAPILRAAALAALTPETEGKKLGRQRALFAALEKAIQAVGDLPPNLTVPEQASLTPPVRPVASYLELLPSIAPGTVTMSLAPHFSVPLQRAYFLRLCRRLQRILPNLVINGEPPSSTSENGLIVDSPAMGADFETCRSLRG